MMQNRKSVLAVFVLLLTLTLFFSTLPLYAVGVNGAGGTVTEGSSNGATNNGAPSDGALEEAAEAARDAVDGVMDGAEDLLPENGAETTIPDQNTPTPADGDNGDDTTPDMGNKGTTDNGDTTGSGAIPSSGATLGDTDGDGITDDGNIDTGAIEDGFSWGWLLFILLAAVVVIVIIALCVPKRG